MYIYFDGVLGESKPWICYHITSYYINYHASIANITITLAKKGKDGNSIKKNFKLYNNIHHLTYELLTDNNSNVIIIVREERNEDT